MHFKSLCLLLSLGCLFLSMSIWPSNVYSVTPFSLMCLGGWIQLYIFIFLSVSFPLPIILILSFLHVNFPFIRRLWLTLCAALLIFSFSVPARRFLLPQKNEGDLFHRLWHVMNEILDLRRQVLVGHLTHDRMRDVKQHITARLDWGNEWVEQGQKRCPNMAYGAVVLI